MKKGFLSLAIALAAAASLQAKDNGSEVLMTVSGKPVTLGEFEYLYHKNNTQQVSTQPIDEYLQMFITYKQKVADAEAEGIDKTQTFTNEFEGYRRDLAEPYMRVQEVEDSIINAIYDRMKEEVSVSHIMVANRGEGVDREAQRTRLDSIRTAILNGADFATLARRFSIDRSVVRNGGDMGYITAARYPYTFEDAAYTTPVGEISPVIETPFGFHIVRVNDRRPARGQVLVEHILKLTQGLSEEEAAVKKAQIDSIASLLAAGGDFEAIARAESEDPGSKREGGRLNWFGTGMMVPEFEAASFALANGETSAPIKTSYGYHIIRKLDSRGIEPLETVRPIIKNAIAQDDRSQLPRKRKVEQLRKKFKAEVNRRNLDAVRAEIIANGGLDSTLEARFIASNRTVASYGKTNIPLSEVTAEVAGRFIGDPQKQAEMFEDAVQQHLDMALLEAERDDLATNNPDYRNLDRKSVV